MKALSIGRLVNDINILVESYPVEGTEIVSKEMITCSGGAANIVAYSLGKWNMESFISGVIGYDETGNFMKKNMEENKVKTNYLETNYDLKTPSSYILINKQNNSRTVISNEVNNVSIKKYDYETNMDCVIVDSYEYNASIYAFNKFSNAITILNAKNPHNGLLDYFKYVKYVVASSTVAEAITGLKIDFNNPTTMANIYKKIVDKYPHITLLITMEEKGTIYSVNNEIKVLATMNAEVVDKTGARDIFIAMIAYGLTSGYDLETSIRLATIAEAMSKKTIGSTLSIPILSDIVKYYESKFGSLAKEAKAEVPTTIPEPTVAETPIQQQENPTPQPKTDEQIVSQVFASTPNNNENNNASTN